MEWSSRIRRKPILVIDFSNQDKEESEDESEDKLKPPYSVKNSQEISRLNTAKTQAKIYFLEQKMLEMEKLERENYSLVRSLRALKIGAAEALAEKQTNLQQLRFDILDGNGEDKLNACEMQYEKQRILKSEVQAELKSLREEMEKDRLQFLRELEDRERVIQELTTSINMTQVQLERLEDRNETNQQRLKLIEEINENMIYEKQQSKHLMSELWSQAAPDKFNICLSQISSIGRKDDLSLMSSGDFKEKDISSQCYQEKLRQIAKEHREEILQLKAFYEKKIQYLRQIYERELFKADASSQSRSISHSARNSRLRIQLDDINTQQKNYLSDEIGNRQGSLCYERTNQNRSFIVDSSIPDSPKYIQYKLGSPVYNRRSKSTIEDQTSTSKGTEKKNNINLIDKVMQSKLIKVETPKGSLMRRISKQSTANKLQRCKSKDSFWTKPIMFVCGMVAGGSLTTILSKIVK